LLQGQFSPFLASTSPPTPASPKKPVPYQGAPQALVFPKLGHSKCKLLCKYFQIATPLLQTKGILLDVTSPSLPLDLLLIFLKDKLWLAPLVFPPPSPQILSPDSLSPRSPRVWTNPGRFKFLTSASTRCPWFSAGNDLASGIGLVVTPGGAIGRGWRPGRLHSIPNAQDSPFNKRMF
jgi:hypothetical protein